MSYALLNVTHFLLEVVAEPLGHLDTHMTAVVHGNLLAAILMDLTKAFDCLPHNLLLGKLSAYGLYDISCSLISNYLSNRKQRVVLGPHIIE